MNADLDPPERSPRSPLAAIPDGLRFHRQQVLQYGSLMSLAIPAGSGLIALVLLYGSQSTWRGIVGFLAALIALPTLPLVGLPVAGGSTRWLVAAISSGGLWLFLGHIAARRAARRMASSWPEWRQQWWRLAIGAWLGSLMGMGCAGAYLLFLS